MRCKCKQTKPCSFCYHWFECCLYGEHPEKCHRYKKYKDKEGGDNNGL